MINKNDKQLLIAGSEKLKIEISSQQMESLDKYAELLFKWQKKFNLIGPDTVPFIYSRHILDCLQILPYIKNNDTVLDIGSGAGLPSVIISIMSEAKVFACERNGKKVQFLNQVRRELKLSNNFSVLQEDIYQLHEQGKSYCVITSRAFSELKNIFMAGEGLLAPRGRYVLLKGSNANVEITNANLKKDLAMEKIESITNSDSKILLIENGCI